MAPEPVTTSVWLEQQLQRALARIDGLAGEVEQLREALHSEQAESSRLHDELALLTGRTSRHEATLDQIRTLQQRAGALEERIEAEAALRRDHASAAGREQQREVEAHHDVEVSVARLEGELSEARGRMAALEERVRRMNDDFDGVPQDNTMLDARLDMLERRIEALASAARRDESAHEADAEALPELRLAFDGLEARTRAVQAEQQRLADEVARLVPTFDGEAGVSEAFDQVRSLRERVEVRLSALEGLTAETSHRQSQAAEERALLRREIAGHDARIRDLIGTIEMQREIFIEHVRRAATAAEDAGRRQMQEIDRQARVGRELVTRLTEQSEAGAKEQPL